MTNMFLSHFYYLFIFICAVLLLYAIVLSANCFKACAHFSISILASVKFNFLFVDGSVLHEIQEIIIVCAEWTFLIASFMLKFRVFSSFWMFFDNWVTWCVMIVKLLAFAKITDCVPDNCILRAKNTAHIYWTLYSICLVFTWVV